MNWLANLMAIALSWPVPGAPAGFEQETEAAYRDRVGVIVEAIGVVTNDPDEAAALLIMSRDESTWDRWIHAGLTHPDPRKHQDHGRARCVLQIHRSRLVPEWQDLAGTDLESTVRCMRAGLRLLRGAAGFCKASLHTGVGMERALSLYATGRSCTPIALARVRTARWGKVRIDMRSRRPLKVPANDQKQAQPGAPPPALPPPDLAEAA